MMEGRCSIERGRGIDFKGNELKYRHISSFQMHVGIIAMKIHKMIGWVGGLYF